MSKKLVLLGAAAVLSAVSLSLGIANHAKARTGVSDVTIANIEAFAATEELDCKYVNNMYECSIYVGVGGALKVLGKGIIGADPSGRVTFDGRVVCTAGGEESCKPVECTDIYELIFK